MKPSVWLAALCLALSAVGLEADDVRITLPASIAFAVTNVGVATQGTPGTTTVGFSNLDVPNGRVLRISIKADGNFVPPGGTAIPAANVSWTIGSARNGVGSPGTLSTSIYRQLFQSAAGRRNGDVNVSWSLAAPGGSIRAGVHTLTVRWKLESITP